MQIQDLIQGSPQWLAYRAKHFNASDAPAMMGCSPYKTRSELLRELHTGLSAEVDAHTQSRFDDGHRFEALARPLAEEIIGDDLYPITGSEGDYSASFDGLTLDGLTAFEHKTLNDDLRAAIRQQGGNANDFLAPVYRIQMEQQLMVSGAERVLFMASLWHGDKLAEERHCWYTADMELRAKIIAGWAQFKADLAAYVPPAAVEVVTAAPQEHLPAVSVQVSGSLAVVSNLTLFGTALRAFVAKIPAKPSTDQEFADTDAACKRLKEAEDRLQGAEEQALASMADVNDMRRMVAELRELARTTRLASEKMVAARKEAIRGEIVAGGVKAYADHIRGLNDRLGRPIMPQIATDFAGVIKGKRTVASLQDAVDTELARVKIAANEVADRIAVNLRTLEAQAAHASLFPDSAALALKAPDDLAAVISSRIAAHEAAEKAKEEAKQAIAQAAAPAPVVAAPAPAAPTISAGSFYFAAPAPAPAAAPAADDPATLKLGTICERLGFNVTAALLADVLHIQHAATDKRAMLYRESQWPLICRHLQAHIGAMLELHTAEA